ncbi:MAG: ROK family protein [Clostridia bacterium]
MEEFAYITKANVVKEINNNLVFDKLLGKESCALTEIAEDTNLSFPTVARVVDSAIMQGFALKSEIINASRGRKPQCYSLNGECAFSLFLFVWDNFICAQIRNFVGQKIYYQQFSYDKQNYLKDVENIIAQMLLIKQIDLIVLALAGVVNEGVIVSYFHNASYAGLEIEKQLKKKFGINVIVENNMKILAKSAIYQVKDVNHCSVATIHIGERTCNTAFLIDGVVLRGNNGFAGELAFLPMQEKAPKNEQICSQYFMSIIAMINPTTAIVYNDNQSINLSIVIKLLKEQLPEKVVPNIILAKNLIEDALDGMNFIANEYRKKTFSKQV